jgi:hypothetical protein
MKYLGFTIVELLVGGTITLIGLLGISALMIKTVKTNEDIKQYAWINQIRSEIIKSLKSKSGWKNTVIDTRNSDFQCLRNKLINPESTVNCSSEGGRLEIVQSPSNSLIIDTRLTKGFDKRGNTCDQFGSDPLCLFRYEISWIPKCQKDNCLNPDFVVTGNLKVTSLSKTPLIINPSFYTFTTYVTNSESREGTCQVTGIGEVNGENCRIKLKFVTCENDDEFLVGFERDGKPRCSRRSLPRCHNGFIYGVSNLSEALCDARTCI